MTSLFKAERNLIRIVQNHSIGKAVCESTNLDLGKIFEHCSLEIPDEAQPGVGWLVTWSPNELDIDPSHLHIVQVLLKLAWLYSEKSDSPLKTVVSQELTMFQAGMKLEASRRQRIEAAQKERPWSALDQWISKKLKSKTKWTSKMLWAVLPTSHDGDSIYLAIGYRAFCEHVRRQREKNKCR